jgi:hypothetical protein
LHKNQSGEILVALENNKMPITNKEANQLNNAKLAVRQAWAAACLEAGVPTDTKFVVFNNASDLAKRHNELMGEFFKLRNRIQRNMNRRDRHAVMSDMGLKRVKGALGGTYYE